MRIGLIDVDGHNFPNLALMKIAAFHKKQGDTVEWVNYFERYDKVYASKVFTFTPDICSVIQAEEIECGGTGYNIHKKLPDEIESEHPDYSIYPMFKFSLQFFSRGCIRHCPFCIVREKEGNIKPVEPMLLNPNGKSIEVLDNNFFANPEWKKSVEYLINQKQPINLHGVDVRIMNEEQAYWLSKLRIDSGKVHIAWDNPRDNIIPQLKELIKYVKPYKITCYIIIGFNSSIYEDYERVIKLRELGVNPFIQPYRDFHNKRISTQYEKDFASWVNKKERLKSFDFKNFSPRKGFYCREYFNN